MHLTLLVPELLWPEPEDQFAWNKLACPGLELLLARATLTRRVPLAHEAWLADHFGLPPLGWAALRLAGEACQPAEATGQWLCADPVHLRFHHERIVIADALAFELEQAEAQALADTLNEWPDAPGRFHVASPHRWYLRLHQPLAGAQETSQPLSAVTGRRLEGELTDSPLAATLRHWQNEIQMLLHTHDINAARQARGLPAVNGLWLWGSGTPATRPPPACQPYFFGNDPLATQMARSAGCQSAPLPDSIQHLGTLPPQADACVLLDQLLLPSRHEAVDRWRDRLQQLEAQWFAPLAGGLTGIRHLKLAATTAYGQLNWEMSAFDRWKIWRRPKASRQIAQQLAIAP